MPNVEQYVLKMHEDLSKKLDRIEGKRKRTESGLSGMARTVGTLFAAGAIARGITNIGRMGGEMEQTRIAFATFLKDADKANKVIADLNQFANVTPYDNQSVIQSGRLLLAAQVPAEELTDTLKAVGDVAAGVSAPLGDIARIYGKAMNKGKVQGEELMQMAERGIPIIDVLSQMFGITKEQVFKMSEQGKLSSAVMKQAFKEMTKEGGLYFNLMQKQSKSGLGKISTLMGKLQLVGIQLGEKLIEAMKPFIDFLIVGADWLGNNTDLIIELVQVLGVVGGVLGSIILATKAWAAYQAIVNGVLWANPIGLIVAAITAVVYGTMKVVKNWDTWGKKVAALTGPLGMILSVIHNIWKKWEYIKNGFTQGGIVAGIKRIALVLMDALLEPVQVLLEMLSKIPGLGHLAEKGANAISNIRAGLNTDYEQEQARKRAHLGFVKGLNFGGAETASGTNAGAGSGNATGALATGTGVGGVASSAPKQFVININSLIGENNQIMSNTKEGFDSLKRQIEETLLQAINDSQALAR
jgi:tape measure domain-containing protein